MLIQVSLDGDPARGGTPLGDLAALADHIARVGELRLRGVMAVAPSARTRTAPSPAWSRHPGGFGKITRMP